MIRRIDKEVGSITTTPEEISKVFYQFYKGLFSSSNPERIDGCLNSMTPKVNVEMNSILTKRFIEVEIKVAIFQMNPLSSPGLDGFPAAFYQTHWINVGPTVCEAAFEFLTSFGEIAQINETYIDLIPTIRNPKKVFDFSQSLYAMSFTRSFPKCWQTG